MSEKVLGADRFGTGKATGALAHAEGQGTIASYIAAHAEGTGSLANALNSHAEGNQTTASGAQSHAEGSSTIANTTNAHAEGDTTHAYGTASHAEGKSTAATGVNSHAEGESTTASGVDSHAEGGTTTASGNYSRAEGQWSTAPRYGQRAKASSGFAAAGDAQTTELVLMGATTDATPKVLTAGNTAVSLTGVGTNVLTVPVDRMHRFRCEAVARRTDVTGDYASWTISGTVVRDHTGSARFLATPAVVTESGGASGATWTLVATVNTTDATNNFLAFTATGATGVTIRWCATLITTEVG